MNVHRSVKNLPSFKNSVVTFGTFDGVHLGHQKIINRINTLAKEFKGESILVTYHPHPRSIIYPKDKSLRLLTSIQERLDLFEKMGLDHVVIIPFSFEFSRISPKEYIERFIIKNFNPACIVIGYDHKFGLNRQGDFQLLQQYSNEGAFQLQKIEKQELEEMTISSTKIRQALLEGNIQDARMFLGYYYSLEGSVVHGDKIGRSIGFPTANLVLSNEQKILPKEGIYAVKVYVDGIQANGMAYIGKRPTVKEGLDKSVEINLFDFDSNIYNKEMTVEFVKFIRNDEKFDSMALMTNQLKLDKIEAEKILKKHVGIPVKTDCAIAILAYNNSEFLQSFLPIIEEFLPSNCRTYVIDNKSTDDTVEMIKEWFPEIQLIELTKNYGFAEGYNRGIKSIKEDYIALVNSDILVTKNWIEPLLEAMKNDPMIGAVMPKILSIEEKDHFEYAGASGGYIDSLGYPYCRGRIFNAVEKDEGQYDSIEEVFWVSGAAMLVKKETFINLGGFDNSFFAHQEEIDLCWRMKRAGLICKVLPQSVVYHFGGGSMSYASPRKTYLNFRNNLTTIIKNEPVGKLLWLLPIRFILDGVAGLKFVLEGKFKHTWSIVRAHLSLYRRVFRIFRRKKQERKFIEQHLKGPVQNNGRHKGSIIWKHFVRGKQKFSEL